MNKKRGLTLVEILAAIAILVIGLIPIMRILPEGIRSSRRVERLTKGTLLAQDKADEIRSQILGDNSDYGFDKEGGYGETGNFASDPEYYYTLTDDQGSNIKELSVTVWFDEDGDGIQDDNEENVRLDTKIADRG